MAKRTRFGYEGYGVRRVVSFAGKSAVITGILAATEAPDSGSFTGTAGVAGILLATEAQDNAVFAGNFVGIASGILSAVEAPDSAVFFGTAAGMPVGILSVTEAPDICAMSGSFIPLPQQVSPSPYPSKYDYGWYDRMPPIRGKGRR